MIRFAEGFQRQRGNIFGFGGAEETSLSLSTMDQAKLEKAPVNNLDAERAVASINHETKKIRGKKELKSASRSHVIAKSLSLTEGKVANKNIRQMEKKKVLPSIVDAWEKRQEGLSKDELSAKETQNRAVDQRRNADLEKLKAMGGPFSSSAEVKLFATSDLPEREKVARLYLEVRLARDSCVSFPKNYDIFRLKRNYKNLDSVSYCDNFVVFFDKITFRNNVTMEDFDSALNALNWVNWTI